MNTTVTTPCRRCGGGRTLSQYRHVAGGVCFECGGSGTAEVSRAALQARESRQSAAARKAEAAREQAQENARRHAEIRARLEPALEERFGDRTQAVGAYRFFGLCEVAAKVWGVALHDLETLERMAAA